ncbi:MAG TPA: hypothetical protein PLH19_07040 [Anaerolineae bacterium]|nr:hypothetical protein [Anaerolineae bacterium]HQH38277.1 hypothetical protein [Anaerolineae bacterium]
MEKIEELIHRLARDVSFRTAFVNAPEETSLVHGLALTEGEYKLLESLRPLLTLRSGELLHRLLDGTSDAPPEWWRAQPFSANATP